MIDDLARPARTLVAGVGLAVGLVLGWPVSGASDATGRVLVVLGLAVEAAVVVGVLVERRRADRRLRLLLATASAEVVRGAVVPVPALGRVVRRRVEPGAADVLTVLTAVGDGPPRRVAALVPVALGVVGRGAPARLLVHPHHRGCAVLDTRVTVEDLGAVAADPRWSTERLPTDRAAVGGYPLLVAAVVGGLAVGTGLAVAAVGLVT